MSFFGFDATLPRDGPNKSSASRGMFESHDPFAGLSRGDGRDAGVTLDFEETYDGLGHQLDESGDTFNDDTFGGDEPVTRDSVGRDFDFAGQTAGVRDTLLEEQVLHQARNPIRQTRLGQAPARSGYEAYRQPEYIPKLEADASIWGTSIASRSSEPAPAPAATQASKMMSLEEVEAQMRSQARPAAQQNPNPLAQTQGLKSMLGLGRNAASPAQQPVLQQQRSPQILQRPQVSQPDTQPQQLQYDPNLRAPQVLQRQHSPLQQMQQQQSPLQQPGRPQSQNFDARPGQPLPGYPLPPHVVHQSAPPVQPPRGPAMQQPGHGRGPSYNGPPVTHPQQLMHLSGTEREAFLAEEAKRAKRNHKIFLLSKNNGMMTPQDKNFITRIQLQQLLTATGGVSQEPGGGDPLAEDFYYQVYAQIRGPPRSGPGQPLNQFAQTYLFQTGGGNRYGYGRSRHHPRGGNGGHGGNADNHVARMEQQVARAVEAAKARPKNKQLTMEGSLGKIAFSNSKTPRPLLNIKRPDTPSVAANVPANRPADRKTALRNVEALYTVLMQLEDHERRLPPPPNEESPPEVIEGHMRWRRDMQALNQRLWEASKVMEPIQQSPTTSHPFIQFLGPSKGKKAIPRIFRHLDDQQRLTLLTLLAIHLDSLDAVRDTFPSLVSGTPLPAAVRDEVELFCAAVMPPLFSYVNEAPLGIIIGLVGLILDRVSVPAVVRTKVGISMLTMLISRAELVKQVTTGGGGGPGPGPAQQPPSPDDWQHWTDLYSRLFDTVEPSLPALFPATANPAASAADVHIWQFLAAMGVAAGPDQQQRLVLGVKDRVMETVAVARTLPADGGMRDRRLAEVNLFMRAIGLDVELLG